MHWWYSDLQKAQLPLCAGSTGRKHPADLCSSLMAMILRASLTLPYTQLELACREPMSLCFRTPISPLHSQAITGVLEQAEFKRNHIFSSVKNFTTIYF